MLKILLVYDDFQELTSVELMLKKIGFDVLGITSEFSLSDQLLAFNPQIVVAQGRTTKVSSASVGRRLRESLRWDGHSILIFYPQVKPQPTELLKMRMDVGLEYPVEPTKMVQVLAQLGNLDANQLLDKLIKTMSQDAKVESEREERAASAHEQESVYVSGGQNQDESRQDIRSSSQPLFPLENPEAGSAQESKSSVPIQGPQEGASEGEKSSPLSFNPFQMESPPQDPLMQELENLLKKKTNFNLNKPPLQDSSRHKKYEEYLKTVSVPELSSIKRREAKLRLKEMTQDIDKSEFESQDVLRREFVKALYKKEG